jgi:hypothetical protein
MISMFQYNFNKIYIYIYTPMDDWCIATLTYTLILS